MAGGGTAKQGGCSLTSQQLSVLVITVLLGSTGLCVLVWMAAAGWKDVTGIVVGVIFVVLTLLQAAFAVMWWRNQKKLAQDYSVQQEEEMIKPSSAQRSMASPSSGDAANLLVTDEVKIAFTDGAQKVDIEMVTVG